MGKAKSKGPPHKQIRVVMADDSSALRRVYRSIFEGYPEIELVGEAENGIDALDLVLKLRPDVILLDLEMPLMDGMTTLQHLMIHTPIPTIMFSSLSKEGTASCFDALRYGAVDFVEKTSFFMERDRAGYGELLFAKICAASRIKVSFDDPLQSKVDAGRDRTVEKVLFCEECGTRHVAKINPFSSSEVVRCRNCGDEIKIQKQERYQRMSFVTVIGAGGAGGYYNLLRLIPLLQSEMGGAVLVSMHDRTEHIEAFVEYLDSISDIRVFRGRDGLNVDGGCCYLVAGAERATISPYSGNYSLKIEGDAGKGQGIDILMESVSRHLRENVAGVLLSGAEDDGFHGMEMIMAGGGRGLLLTPGHCLAKEMGRQCRKLREIETASGEEELVEKISALHFRQKAQVQTA